MMSSIYKIEFEV